MKLPLSFYNRPDVVQISKELLGKSLFTHFNGITTAGIITETEAYCGATDRACHAYPNKRTKRTETMFAEGGINYTYLCYGIHHLFNIVTNQKDQADAILIRAIEPNVGIETMLERRNMIKIQPRLTAGPGCLTRALGIRTEHNGESLRGEVIWIEDNDRQIAENQIVKTTRIGVDYAGEDALLPWRFYIEGNKWVSKK
ncbi:MAG: DNA-3-methyladenine glycosylase [Chitinophagales bacterium]